MSKEFMERFDVMFGESLTKIKSHFDPRIVTALDNVPFAGSMRDYSRRCDTAARNAMADVALEDANLLPLIG